MVQVEIEFGIGKSKQYGKMVKKTDIFGNEYWDCATKDTWGYVIWNENYEQIHEAYGFESELDAEEDAVDWLDDVYGPGRWCC